MAPMRRSLVSCEQMTEKLILNSVLDILNLIPFSIVNCGHLLQGLSKLTDDCRTVLALYSLLQAFSLSPTGSALARTDLSPLTNGNWVIHAEYSCFLHPPFLAKIGYIP